MVIPPRARALAIGVLRADGSSVMPGDRLMRAAFGGIAFELPAFFHAGSEAVVQLDSRGATLNIKRLPGAASAPDIATAYWRFLLKAVPGIILRAEEQVRSPLGQAVRKDVTFQSDGETIYQQQIYMVAGGSCSFVATCTVPGADVAAAARRATGVLGELGRWRPCVLALGQVSIGLAQAPASASALFLPAAQAGFFRPSVSVAYQPAGGTGGPRAQAEKMLRELCSSAEALTVIEQGPLRLGSLEAYRQELVFRHEATPIYAAHLHLAHGKRLLLMALTCDGQALATAARAGRALAEGVTVEPDR